MLEPVKVLAAQGYEVTYLKPDRSGHVSPDALRAALRPDTVLVSMMLVNNELGTLLPVAEAAQSIRDAGSPALLHCDAVQAFLKVPFTPAELGWICSPSAAIKSAPPRASACSTSAGG